MKIYGMQISTCTRKVMLTLHEKNTDFELITVDLMKAEQKQAEHLSRHPFGVIPVLDDNGYYIYESRAIIRYLDKRLPGIALTPTDLKDYGHMEQWLSVESSYFSQHALVIIKQLFWGPMRKQTPDAAAVAVAVEKVTQALDVINQTLANQPYLGGEQFSLADISWMPYVGYLFPATVGHLITEREHVNAWWQRVSVRPSWLKINN